MNDPVPASKALRALRQRSGLSVRQVADMLGVPLSTYSSYERTFKRPYLPIELVTKLANVFVHYAKNPLERKEVLALGMPKDDLEEMSEVLMNVVDDDAIISASIAEKHLIEKAGYDRHKPFLLHPSNDFISVRAVQRFEGQVHFTLLETEAGYRPRPRGIHKDEQVFAFLAPDDRLAPRWRTGEVVFVHPFRPPVPGEHALIFVNQDGRPADEVYFAKFVIGVGERIIIEFYTVNAWMNGSRAMAFDVADVKAMWRVFEWPELLG